VCDLSQARLIGNLAQSEGGGLYARGRLLLHDAELAHNVAGTHGGGVSLPADGTAASRIERTSFHANTAGGNGGAVAASAPRVWIENVSSHANVAVGPGGGFHIGSQPHAFRFNTSFGDSGLGGSALHAAASMQVKGNVFTAPCTGPGAITDLGSSVRATAAAGCPGVALPAAPMGLGYGDWGGPFNVVGFGPGSSLAGLVPAAAGPPSLDVRGFARTGPVFDPGAFEHDAR
jgi:predicted outer membrane repeat protein